MSQYQEVILKAGPAPKVDPPHSNSTKMPAHTATKRSPKKTNGPLTGRGGSFKSPAKRRSKASPRKRKPDTEYDNFDTDYDEDIDQEQPRKSPRTTFSSEDSPVKVIGIDLGMWGHGRSRALSGKDPAVVTADLNWSDSQVNQFKRPSIVAFKKDNSKHRAFRQVREALVGFNVTPDMVSCSFFKASLDQRDQPSKFDNPVLRSSIASSLVSFSTPEEDEKAAIAVMKDMYEQELDNSVQTQVHFDEHTIEETKLVFVLTYPAACSKKGRDKLEQIAKAAGLGSRKGDKIKLLSEAQAAAMASFISYRAVEKHEVWKTYFKVGEWVTVLDIGSLTVDTTTEEIISNDPRVQLRERIVSEGGRCGTVTLHLHLLELIQRKFGVMASDLPQTLVGRNTQFHDECERLLRTFTSKDSAAASTLPIRLPDGVAHDDYDASYGDITLQVDEIKQLFDEYVVFPKELLLDQWKKARDLKHKVKTIVVCGGGSLLPYLWAKIFEICQEHGVKAVVPDNPIAAVCRGAVISELSDSLIGQRLVRAHFGIKVETNGVVGMRWPVSRGDIIDTTAPKMLENIAGHLTLNIEEVLNQAAKFHMKIYTYDRDDRKVTDPNDPGVEEIASMTLDKSNMSTYLQNKLADSLKSLDADSRKKANLNVEVWLGVDESARLYFQAKAGGSNLGKHFLRYDFTKNFL